MFGLFKQSEATLQINNSKSLVVNPKETILQAALREGINFPYSCKVGGCATCKCKLESGKVKELTDSGYILSAEDLQAGYILACQSVPKTDVAISVNLSSAAVRQITGKITSQKKLTQNLCEVQILLDEPMRFKPGQHARLSINDNSEISRPYSFANCPEGEMRNARFFVKAVENGQLSNRLYSKDLENAAITLEGPLGDFLLQENYKPALFIATGSGLAPILSILESMKSKEEYKNSVLLFGAKTQADLYVLDEIKTLAEAWPKDFKFVPTLSQEPEGSSWTGVRGRVTEQIHKYILPESEAYLCGSPEMVDDCEKQLQSLGMETNNIFADRFVTEHNTKT